MISEIYISLYSVNYGASFHNYDELDYMSKENDKRVQNIF